MSEIRDWLATTLKQNFNFERILATQLWSHTSHMTQTLDQQHGHNRRPSNAAQESENRRRPSL